MSDFDKYHIGSVEYWDERVNANRHDLDGMIFNDWNRDQYWDVVRKQLSLWKDLTVVDLCCGWGRFSEGFDDDKYTGFDFSKNIIAIAQEKYPNKKFVVADVKTVLIHYKDPFTAPDVIFEVNSLHVLGMTPDQFHEHFKGKAKIIACLERDRLDIYYDW